MSLLMDALRKAEADKRRVSEAGSTTVTRSHPELEEVGRDPGGEQVHGAEEHPELIVMQDDSNPGLTLEPMEPAPLPPELGDLEDALAALSDLTEETIAAESLDRAGAVSGQSRSATVSSVEAARGSAVTPSHRTDSGIAETVATANTVFDAGSTGHSRTVLLWGVAAIVVVACLAGGAAFYFFKQTPTQTDAPLPTVALGLESGARSPSAPIDGVASPEPPALEPQTSETTAEEPETSVPGPKPDVVAETAVSVAPDDADGLEVPAREAGTKAPPPGEPDVARVTGGAATAAPAVPDIGVSPGELRIARSDKAMNVQRLIKQAYDAYRDGDYAAAEALYERAGQLHPNNRDVLLGSAALRMQSGAVGEAHRLYREVLNRDPDNPTAAAALFALEGGNGDELTESRLKMLLDQGVDSGYIYFSLGNLYARNNRWADAQQAYFEAYRQHPGSPDYNYNLAVSLDRLGQRAAALKFYETAIDLNDGENAGFDLTAAAARVHAIKGSAGTTP